MSQGNNVGCYVNEQLTKEINEAANQAGLSRAAWIKQAILKALSTASK